MTAQNLIEDAYRLVGRKDLEPDDLVTGLSSLNVMIDSWKLEFLIPFMSSFSQLTGTLRNKEYARVIKYNLAMELGDEKNNAPSQRTINTARDTMKALKQYAAIQAINEEATFDQAITRTLRR